MTVGGVGDVASSSPGALVHRIRLGTVVRSSSIIAAAGGRVTLALVAAGAAGLVQRGAEAGAGAGGQAAEVSVHLPLHVVHLPVHVPHAGAGVAGVQGGGGECGWVATTNCLVAGSVTIGRGIARHLKK